MVSEDNRIHNDGFKIILEQVQNADDDGRGHERSDGIRNRLLSLHGCEAEIQERGAVEDRTMDNPAIPGKAAKNPAIKSGVNEYAASRNPWRPFQRDSWIATIALMMAPAIATFRIYAPYHSAFEMRRRPRDEARALFGMFLSKMARPVMAAAGGITARMQT